MKTTTEEKIAVMQAAEAGKEIQYRRVEESKWSEVSDLSILTWNWYTCDYRVKPPEPLVCWVVVADDVKLADRFTSVWPTKQDAEDSMQFEAIPHTIRKFVEVVE